MAINPYAADPVEALHFAILVWPTIKFLFLTCGRSGRIRAGNGSLSDPEPKWPIELLTHDPRDPWPMGHRGRHPILAQAWHRFIDYPALAVFGHCICTYTFKLLHNCTCRQTARKGTCEFRVWRSTRAKTNEMPFLNFLLVLFLTLSFTVNFL